MRKSLNNVDWDLLHRQKFVLLAMLDRQPSNAPEAEALSGLINLLDALQDDAADAGIWSFPEEADDVSTVQPAPKRYYVEDDEGHHHGPMDTYEDAATIAEAVHGRIIEQQADLPLATPEQDGREGGA